MAMITRFLSSAIALPYRSFSSLLWRMIVVVTVIIVALASPDAFAAETKKIRASQVFTRLTHDLRQLSCLRTSKKTYWSGRMVSSRIFERSYSRQLSSLDRAIKRSRGQKRIQLKAQRQQLLNLRTYEQYICAHPPLTFPSSGSQSESSSSASSPSNVIGSSSSSQSSLPGEGTDNSSSSTVSSSSAGSSSAGAPGPSPECLGEAPQSDQLFLLKETDGLQVSIFERSGGRASFRATLGNRTLRESYDSEKFFAIPENGLNITYSISRRCGGVDVSYRIENPSSNTSPITLPDLMVEGFQFDLAQSLQRLRTKDVGNLIDLEPSTTVWEDGSYPQVYSPVLTLTDANFAAGTALLFPVLDYRQTVLPTLQLDTSSGEMAGSFRQRYAWPREEGYPVDINLPAKRIAPGEVRNYTITVRFSTKRYWVATLSAYKSYFNSLYGAGRIPQASDLRPIRSAMLADSAYYNASTNPRAFVTSLHLQDQGWNGFVPNFVNETNSLGYKRTMLWLPSGRYGGGLNFPPQFMDFTPLMQSTSSALSQFASSGVGLGFWWGRSTQIPIFGSDPEWNPIGLESANPEDSTHVSFLTTQLSKALAFGAGDIALDYFVAMPLYQRYGWAGTLRGLAPNVVFAGEGQQADLIHTRIANHHDTQRGSSFILPPGPDVLSNYINPGSTNWLQLKSSSLTGVDRAVIQQLIHWGYTPLVLYQHADINVDGLSLTRAQCSDGIDNNGDGLVDFPFDPNCDSAADMSEAVA